jgi:hypothetical protein
MKKRDIILSIVVLIIVAVLIVVVTGRWEKLTGRMADFAIADSLAVNKFQIAGIKDTVNIERTRDGWIVNGNYKADPVAVGNFLYAFSWLQVNSVMNSADTGSVPALRIRIWHGRRYRQLRFYPGAASFIMNHKNSGRFYRVGVTGLPDANLRQIINSNPDYWKDKLLLNLSADDISQIKTIPYNQPGEGFIIQHTGDSIRLEATDGSLMPDSIVDNERLLMYLSYFTHIYYDSTVSPGQLGGKMQKADYMIEITDQQGRKYKIEMYPLLDSEGNIDDFRGLVRFNDDKRLMVVRYVMLDLMRQTLSHFTVK